MHLCRMLSQNPSDIHPRMIWVCLMVLLVLVFWVATLLIYVVTTANLHIYQLCVRTSFLPKPVQYLLFDFLIIIFQAGERWNLKVLWIWTSLINKDAEGFPKDYWAFVLHQLRIVCSFNNPCTGLFGLFVFSLLRFLKICILVINFLSDIVIKILFHSVGCQLTWWVIFLSMQKFFIS